MAANVSGSTTGFATTAPSQIQLVHAQPSWGSLSSDAGVSSQCAEQQSQMAQAFSALDGACDSQAMQRSGQVNKLTIKSNARRGDLISVRIAHLCTCRNLSPAPDDAKGAGTDFMRFFDATRTCHVLCILIDIDTSFLTQFREVSRSPKGHEVVGSKPIGSRLSQIRWL